MRNRDFQIRLIPDPFHIHHVGRLKIGALFWIDVQLAAEGQDTRDFVAAYIFDLSGALIHHRITDCGLRAQQARNSVNQAVSEALKPLGEHDIAPISIYPFQVESHGKVIVLKKRPAEETEVEDILVDALPGYTLMFYPPWEEGLYDS